VNNTGTKKGSMMK